MTEETRIALLKMATELAVTAMQTKGNVTYKNCKHDGKHEIDVLFSDCVSAVHEQFLRLGNAGTRN
jgi:hypothetical protein